MTRQHNEPAETFTEGLRRLADLLDATDSTTPYDNYRHLIVCSTRDELVQTVRRLGGRWDKDEKPDHWFGMTRQLGGRVSIYAYVAREQVCEKRVVGTKTVLVPADDAPMVEVEREIVEWVCPGSLLAETRA